MRTLAEIRKENKRNKSLLNTHVTSVVQLSEKEYAAGRKEYEEFVKPVSQKVFTRQLMRDLIK